MAKERYIQQGSEYIDILNHVNYWKGKKKVICIMLSGPPGIGKTFMVDQIAKELDCFKEDINGHPGTTREDIEGVPTLVNGTSGWRNGPVPRIVNKTNENGIALLAIHEFNIIRTEVQPSLNSVMDYQGKFSLTTNANIGFEIKEGNTLVIISTINENIMGVMPIQESVMSRFNKKINLTYPKLTIESEVLKMKTDLKVQWTKELCKFAKELRKGSSMDGILERDVSPRELIAFIDSARVPGVSLESAFKDCIVNKIADSKDQVKFVNDLASGFDFFVKMRNMQFEGETQEIEKEESKVQHLKIPPEDILDVKTMNRLKQNLTVTSGRTYIVNELPKKILFNSTNYNVVGKGQWIPNNQWIAKILGRNNALELQLKHPSGKKEIKSTKIKFQIA